MVLKKGNVSFDEIKRSFKSWCGHASHCNSYKLVNDFKDDIKVKK